MCIDYLSGQSKSLLPDQVVLYFYARRYATLQLATRRSL